MSLPLPLLRLLAAILIVGMALPASARTPGGTQTGPTLELDGGTMIEVRADSFGMPVSTDENASLYGKPSVLLEAGDKTRFKVKIEVEGAYTLSFDMLAAGSLFIAPEGQLLVDGSFPSEDAKSMVFPIFYQNTTNTFPLDRYGNEGLIRQEQLMRWSNVPMRDVNFSHDTPLQLNFSRGMHTFEFTLNKESMYLGSIYLTQFSPYPDYNQYLQDHPANEPADISIEIEAEQPSFKDDTTIRPVSDRSLEVSPYDTYRLLLNTLGGESWKRSGSTAYYEVEVPQAGLYNLSLRALQNTRNNFTVFRRITVNGSVPFEQLNEVAFHYSTHWTNLDLGGDNPYKIYLNQGVNVIGIEATDAPYRAPIEKIEKVLIDINNLALQIRKLTGNQVDPYKEWVISDYIPDLQEQLTAIADDLKADQGTLSSINQESGSQEILTYQMAIDNILFLAKDPDNVPIHMNRFSEGSGSAAQLLANLLPLLQAQPLALDKIYIHSTNLEPAQVKVPFFTSLFEGTKRFLASFKPDPYQSTVANPEELEVWVNRPRQYVDLLQKMTDQGFTQETGIKVKFSIMPDQNKLILANAAGIQPDVALGVATDVPYELAIRNALYDLRSFHDFDSFIRIYSPGSLLSYIINDSVYAIPETQDFWVTYYRKDILDALGMKVPQTWNEVIEMLPELQRYGMNYNTALSSGAGMKNYLFTAPYLFNFGAQLYSSDGFSTGLASEQAISAIKFMSESFTLYGMPLTTANFYNSFRYGSLPVGISNNGTYIQLKIAAPEINGLWGIDLYPATVLPDGTENRYATGSAAADIMFKNTEKAEQGWQFLKWWMSTATQVDFEQQLILNYGLEYLWFSANLEAVRYLPIPEADKDVIFEQWQWLEEPVKLPGSYMEEREISNAWNKIVFDGVNPRVAIDSSITIINREITRKMEEFGYLQDGVKVKEFKIPTIETVKDWMDNAK